VAADSSPERSSQDPDALYIKRAFRLRAVLLGILAAAAAVFWGSPADALPSFSGQTGAPCSACHIGGFGPQLTPFGIYFKATGYTLGGGTGVWSHIPFNFQTGAISYTNIAKNRPNVPKGWTGTNDYVSPGCASFVIAMGHSFEGTFGVGGIGKVFLNTTNAFVTNTGTIASLGPSDLKFSKPLTVGSHSLIVTLDLNNQATISDPYDNNLYSYWGQGFPLEGPTNAFSPSGGPHLSSVVKTVGGAMLSVLLDNTIYAEVGLYESMNPSLATAIGGTPGQMIAGGAPYARLAWQHQWGSNFLEVGGLFMDIPFDDIPGIANPSAQNEYVDWGLDAMYQRQFGQNVLAITANYLTETQNNGASFAAGKASNATDTIQQFRITGTYAWSGNTEASLAYIQTWGSNDALLYPMVALTGSAAHSPNAQTLIAQVDWAPWGNAKPGDSTFPWLNVRVGVQYRYYLQFNGGTTNYDGSGRNASDNNTLLVFTFWSF
jgi:hypothetical protein